MNNILFETIQELFEKENIVRLVMSSPRRKSLEYKKISLRPILLHEKTAYQCEYHFEKKVTHDNLSPEEAADFVYRYMCRDFKQMDIFTTTEDVQILAKKPEYPRIKRRRADRCRDELSHNRQKKYLIPDGKPCDFLIRLGVMDPSGRVFQNHYSKFRQINRYLEIIHDVYRYLPQNDEKIKIIDFGCGKAYLTFALYHYLHIIKKHNVEIIGLDLKQDVIDFCSGVAADLGYDELSFQMGDIADYELRGTGADMVVTLHACDIATDYALINAVSWNTKVILSVPCCQHELFDQITDPVMDPMLKHGIIKDRFTEILTDGLRGLKLESAGYDVAMIEFTSLEHTARNIMIKAVKTRDRGSAQSKKAAEEYADLCAEYHVHPSIDSL
ncbi:MAG: SAM-dependent methyltransferase [Eubacteriaceae bacterium]|nr:SAM-dependent methyltransferase [Eubacteriaceae bacterium]